MLELQQCLAAAFAGTLRALAQAGGGELVRLSPTPDGVEKVDQACIEKYYDELSMLWENGHFITCTSWLQAAFSELDASYEHRLSYAWSPRARRQWALYEAEKTHAMQSYCARLCRRAANSKSVKIASLKKLWQSRHPRGALMQAPPARCCVPVEPKLV